MVTHFNSGLFCAMRISTAFGSSSTKAPGRQMAFKPLMAIGLALAAGLIASAVLAEASSAEAHIPDPVLRKAFEVELGLEPGEAITQAEIAAIEGRFVATDGVADLTGLEHATGIDWLYLSYNAISDLSPLANLTNLTALELRSNNITDIAPLAGLTNLTTLTLVFNSVTDLSPLTQLTGLEHLFLSYNAISDLSVLSGLPNLMSLSVGVNPAADFSVLANLTQLETLHLYGTSVADLSPLSGLTNLRQLFLEDNAISNLSPLSGLTNLESLDLAGNLISDLSPLGSLTSLRGIGLESNLVSDLRPLAEFQTYLDELLLGSNRISDLSPLRDTNFYARDLHLDNNAISDVSPLLDNTSLTDRLYLQGNPLSQVSVDDHIPALEDEGVDVFLQADDHGNTADAATPIALGASVSGLIAPYNDIDSFRLDLDEATDIIIFGTKGEDVFFYLTDDTGKQLAGEGSIDYSYSQNIERRLAPGTYGIHVYAGGWVRFERRITGYEIHAKKAADVVVTIPDPNLRAAVEEKLHRFPGDPILRDEMAGLFGLEAENQGISDLTGLEHATKLGYLRLGGNQISDLSPLAGLTNLSSELDLHDNAISDLSPLAGQVNLEVLVLHGNQVSDLSPLASLNSLRFLDLDRNLIADLSPLAGLTELEWLQLRSNAITDLSPLAGLEGLIILDLGENEISDLAPLRGLTGLTKLYLDHNQIEHISALVDLRDVRELHLHNNRIREITPLIDHSNTGRVRRGTITLWKNPLMHRTLVDNLPLLESGGWVLIEDDHGNSLEDATPLAVGGSQKGVIANAEKAIDDIDTFRLEVTEAVDLTLFTSGALDTEARLMDDQGRELDVPYDWDGGYRENFRIDARLEPGTYYLEVTSDDIGGYIIHAKDTKANAVLLPLLPAALGFKALGFVRLINHSAEAGTVRLYAREEGGWLHEPLMLNIGSRQTLHFNAYDLAWGNPGKGIAGVQDIGRGHWTLHFESDLDIEALAYARAPDGFLTSMHDVAPEMEDDDEQMHQVVTFNPASNWRQVSSLRLSKPDRVGTEFTIDSKDDLGRKGENQVGLIVDGGTGRQVTAQQLEAGDDSFTHRLGDGTGKWRLEVRGIPGLRVISLMESPTGHLTNLSSVPPSPADGVHRIPLFPSASDPSRRQGFLRVINRSDRSGTVTLTAKDDSLGSYPPIRLSLEANQAQHINSDDLERGNAAKNLAGGFGAGIGDWRIELSSEDLDIQALAYIRAPDGFLTSIHDVVPSEQNVHRVAIFNPASNDRQVSLLRIINDGLRDAQVTIEARDDAGLEPAAPVRLTVPARSTRTLTAQQLEKGDRDIEGALGDGTGKWQFTATSTQPISVMSLMQSPTGHLTNLSTAPHHEPLDWFGYP